MKDDSHDPQPPSAEEIRSAIDLLARLTAAPEVFLDRTSPHSFELKALRAQMNRCVAALQVAAVSHRKNAADARSDVRGRRSPDSSDRSSSATTETRGCYMCGTTLPGAGSPRQICKTCAALNDKYSRENCDLNGKHAVVTGGRMGVGSSVARRLLECGATVHITSRFPHSAANAFAGRFQSGFLDKRLRVYGLDFRDVNAVKRFCEHVRRECEPDILVNNAAQTVRRPPAYYREVLAYEAFASLDREAAQLRRVVPIDFHRPDAEHGLLTRKIDNAVQAIPERRRGLRGLLDRLFERRPDIARSTLAHAGTSAQLAMLHLLPGDVDAEQWLATEETGAVLDRRPGNSWSEKLDDVALPELIEVQCINAIAPFLLVQGLFGGLSGSEGRPKFIVNLAAAEGAFSARHRRGVHPHTNMAKAALNMLTRSIAHEFAARHIFVNSVDPGWVSDQRPYTPGRSEAFVTPLTYDDGASRVVRPIVAGMLDPKDRVHGKLFRNYRPAAW